MRGDWDSRPTCTRCGWRGHTADTCHSKYSKDNRELPVSTRVPRPHEQSKQGSGATSMNKGGNAQSSNESVLMKRIAVLEEQLKAGATTLPNKKLANAVYRETEDES